MPEVLLAAETTATPEPRMNILDPPDNLVPFDAASKGWVRKDAKATARLRRCAEPARPSVRVVPLNGATSDENPSPALLMMVLVGGWDRSLTNGRIKRSTPS